MELRAVEHSPMDRGAVAIRAMELWSVVQKAAQLRAVELRAEKLHLRQNI